VFRWIRVPSATLADFLAAQDSQIRPLRRATVRFQTIVGQVTGQPVVGNERDPLIGNQDGTFDFTMPKRPISRKITGLPAFTTLKGGAYFFLPGIQALKYLAAL
jgi:hypothetical protein